MRVSFSSTRVSASIFEPILSHTYLRRTISLSSISIPPATPKLQTPLFLKPPIYTAALSDLRRWNFWAKTLVNSIGTKFLDTDNGPDSTLLQRELNWLIEDALDTPNNTLCLMNGNDDEDGKTKVKLRADVEDLYVLWKQRIEERRPFQYIVGCEHWRDLVLSVQEGVLIPRPETELIVDLVGDAIEKNPKLGQGLWADLGTGSGALAIGIARILGNTGRVIATDLSHVAVSVSSFNVNRYNLQDKVTVKLGSWFEPLEDFKGEVDGLVSNPPYIPSEHLSGLQAEVGRHEPKLALDGGKDGMDDLLHLCDGAVSMLKPGGFFSFETNGEKHSQFLKEYMENKHESRFFDVKIVTDFAGVQRFVTGFRAS
ncbi:release factor glutamine methyltransferase isoform X1 [Impatiens glandulifera]|uniref:release factor glutamine methyltransferase isoform X1 n=1 Tax=Impatiens glandulifera TaxID=253017 RepID=UPI001FB19EF0|nr:release factor glutamine methyltransferase isoform X1 [Impatiens glandulifera]XP_047324532.1 release factor glutamine methyltransferase isoform X1 [Impatiens glandulifera]